MYQLASAAAMLYNKQPPPPVLTDDHKGLFIIHYMTAIGQLQLLNFCGSAPGASQTEDLLHSGHASHSSTRSEGAASI